MKTKKVKITEVHTSESNPRVIKDHKFKKLVKSIQEFPEMLNLRPIVVNEEMEVLGGNMRLRACIEAGLTEVPIIIASDLTEEQQKEFVIKDNVSFGEWDWDILGNEWENVSLGEWGLDVWQPETDYAPILEPKYDTSEVTDADIEKTADGMAMTQAFASTLEVICPSCGEEFEIKRQ